jgi:predicted PurR-regulated permease PerM
VEARQVLGAALPVAVVILVFFLGALTLSPFAPALLWAIFTAIALLPFHRHLVERSGLRRGVVTVLVAIGLIVIVVVPMVILLRSIIGLLPGLGLALAEGGRLAAIGIDLPPGTPATWVGLWNALRDDLQSLREVIGNDLQFMVPTMLLEGRLIGHFVLEFLLGLILACVILQNSTALGRFAVSAVATLGGERGLDLGRGTVQTIRYTVLGVMGSAAVQTAVAAFAYWLVGAPHWPLLAFATFMMGLLQVGPVLIWAPLAIWLWLDERTAMAIFLVVWGIVAIGLSDNVVKSLVVARGSNLPALLVFLGAVGGLLVWGIVGVFLGPVILAVCLELFYWWLGHERAAMTAEGEPENPT